MKAIIKYIGLIVVISFSVGINALNVSAAGCEYIFSGDGRIYSATDGTTTWTVNRNFPNGAPDFVYTTGELKDQPIPKTETTVSHTFFHSSFRTDSILDGIFTGKVLDCSYPAGKEHKDSAATRVEYASKISFTIDGFNIGTGNVMYIDSQCGNVEVVTELGPTCAGTQTYNWTAYGPLTLTNAEKKWCEEHDKGTYKPKSNLAGIEIDTDNLKTNNWVCGTCEVAPPVCPMDSAQHAGEEIPPDVLAQYGGDVSKAIKEYCGQIEKFPDCEGVEFDTQAQADASSAVKNNCQGGGGISEDCGKTEGDTSGDITVRDSDKNSSWVKDIYTKPSAGTTFKVHMSKGTGAAQAHACGTYTCDDGASWGVGAENGANADNCDVTTTSNPPNTYTTIPNNAFNSKFITGYATGMGTCVGQQAPDGGSAKVSDWYYPGGLGNEQKYVIRVATGSQGSALEYQNTGDIGDVSQWIIQDLKYSPTTGRVTSQLNNSHDCAGWYDHPGHGCWNVNYWRNVQETGEGTDTASLKVPYNYGTTVEATVSSAGPMDAGTEYTVSANIGIKPTSFCADCSTSAYATISRSSWWQVIKYVVAPNSSSNPNNTESDKFVAGTETSSLCGYYPHTTSYPYASTDGVNNEQACQVIDKNSNGTGVRFNSEGNTSGVPKRDIILNDTRYADDVPVGSWVCYAIGVYPASSHDTSGNETGESNDQALYDTKESGSGSHSWHVSKPACVQVAKRPRVQFWGGDIYTEGSVSTNQSIKTYGGSTSTLVHHNTPWTAENWVTSVEPNTRNLYGSWSEYALVLRGQNKTNARVGFATASVYGTGGNSTLAVGNDSMSQNNLYNKQTIANTTTPQGNFVRQNVPHIRDRYTAGSTGVCPTAIYPTKESDTIYRDDVAGISCEIVSSVPSGEMAKGRTYVYVTTGTATISNNITYPEGGYTTLRDLPQVLIFAQDINIAPSVTRIDAWLIATGEIDTCSGGNPSGGMGASSTTASNSCANQLWVNGPAYASKLKLNRIFGAGVDNQTKGGASTGTMNSSPSNQGMNYNNYLTQNPINWELNSNSSNLSNVPAEIFNLREDAYLWAFNQSQTSGQAISTYTREIAPRY